jgi:preprotein translocase subunit YajC
MTSSISASLLALQIGGGSVPGIVFTYGALLAIFYFILIRPQQKQRKAHEALIRTIKRGDEIVTAGGIIGEVVNVSNGGTAKDGTSEPSMSDRVTIKSGESRLVIERGRIARVVSGTTAA